MATIDVRKLPPPERHATVLHAFDGLQAGDTVTVLGDHDPKGLLAHFQQERAGLYDWYYLEEGPQQWKVSILRRGPAREHRDTVSDLLGTDHDRLDEVLLEARRSWSEGDLPAAQESFHAFDVGLRRHIRAEEEILFPAFEALAGMPPNVGPTAVMRMEHREIESALEGIAGALSSGDSREPGAMKDLLRLLESHNRKEEHVLYPMTDDRMDGAERSHLCKQIEAM